MTSTTAVTVLLEENYRSSANILSAAENVINGNRQRVEKRLVPMSPPGLRVFVHEAYDEGDEALWVDERGRPPSPRGQA